MPPHSHHYRDPREPYDFRGRRVLVVGAGTSAMDISPELSQRPIAEQLFISMCHGVWVLPCDAHPSVSGEFLTRVGCGDITPKGAVQRLEGDSVVFAEGRVSGSTPSCGDRSTSTPTSPTSPRRSTCGAAHAGMSSKVLR